MRIERNITAAWKIHGNIGKRTVVKFDDTALEDNGIE
jgi:hypothetical protein